MQAIVQQDPTRPDDWIVIARRELENLNEAYRTLSNDARIDHALRAIEAVLKAILWKHHKWPKWPKRQKPYKFLYGHDLEELLNQCSTARTSLRLSPDHWASWRTVANISIRHTRYSPTVPSDQETHAIAKSTRHRQLGVYPWLIDYYQRMS